MKISESTFYFIGIANGIMQARQPLRLTAEARIRLRPFVCRVPALPAPLPRARAPAAAAVRPHTSHDGAHDLMCDGHQPCPSTRKVGSRRQELERRVWRIAIRRLRLVAGRIRLVAVRNIACACVRVQGYGGGMVGAASARTGSGSLFFFGRPPDDLPWTLRFFGGISCGREGIAGVRRAITAAVRPVAAGERRAGGSWTFCRR